MSKHALIRPRSGNTTVQVSTFFNKSVVIDSRTCYVHQLVHCDPIAIALMTYGTDIRIESSEPRSVRDGRSRDLTLDQRNVYLRGFRILVRLAHKPFRRAFTHSLRWHPRKSLSSYGSVGTFTARTISSVVTGLTDPITLGSQTFHTLRFIDNGNVRHHLSFDNLLGIARLMLPYKEHLFFRDTSNSLSSAYLSEIIIKPDDVFIIWSNCYFKFDGQSRSFECDKLVVRYSRGRADIEALTASYEGLKNAYVERAGIKYTGFNVPEGLVLNYLTSAPATISDSFYLHQAHVSVGHISISDCRPALYHTGAKALSNVLLDYSRNFENLVELPELVTILQTILQGSRLPRNPFRMYKELVRVISGAYLTYSFAIRPSMELLKEVVQGITIPYKGEAEMRFDNRQLGDLPEGLNTLFSEGTLKIVDSADIDIVSAIFRSECVIHPGYHSLVSSLMETNPALRYGLLPSFKGAWDTGSATFIVDWFLPIGRLISDAESYMSSGFVPLRIGHTAKFEVKLKSGQTFSHFMRSVPQSFLADPSTDSWLESPGLQMVSIPLSASILLSKRA